MWIFHTTSNKIKKIKLISFDVFVKKIIKIFQHVINWHVLLRSRVWNIYVNLLDF